MPTRPIIGITTDVSEHNTRLKCDVALAYAQAVQRAGGVPFFLPPIVEAIPQQLAVCSGFVLTGGDDPAMEPFGQPTHPAAKVMHPLRQQYETALLAALRGTTPDTPVLGVCLGMQMMTLDSGGSLIQHLPDVLPSADGHKNAPHEVRPVEGSPVVLGAGEVASHHHQAVGQPGSMVVIARSPDGVIEAVCDPSRRAYVGVQWHPERTADADLGQAIFDRLVRACAQAD